jgi:glycosyltransferase involved in cell wall biosynthesis
LIKSGQTGLLVEYGDVSAMSSAIAKVLTDPELARQLGERGKYLVQTKFDEYTVADRVEEVYNHVLNKFSPLPQWELDLG